MPLPAILIIASSSIILLLGSIHLFYTFHGQLLHPRDPALVTAMQEAVPYITPQTTVWDATIGFNASHSLGAILFGLIYGYLALCHHNFLFSSLFLQLIGALTLICFCVLAWRYWFSTPLLGISMAMVLFITAVGVHAFASQ